MSSYKPLTICILFVGGHLGRDKTLDKVFGCAKVLISDQGREFVNRVNEELQTLLGTQHRMTSAYHPQTNGLVEKFNHTIQSCLLKVVNEHQNDWDEYLDPVLFAIRTSKQKSTGHTPFEMMYKR